MQERVRQILSNGSRLYCDCDLGSLNDNILLTYFVDRIPYHKDEIGQLIINDYARSYWGNPLTLDDAIEVISRLDYEELENCDIPYCFSPNIQLDMAADAYLRLINNKDAKNMIGNACSKQDLKAVVLIGRLYDGSVKDLLAENVQQSAIAVCRYHSELNHFKKTSKTISGIAQAVDFEDHSKANIEQMVDFYDFLSNCYSGYETLRRNPEYNAKIIENHEKFRNIKKRMKKWLKSGSFLPRDACDF